MSPALPSVKPRQLVRALERAGFRVDHQRGSHLKLKHPSDPSRHVIVPMHNRELTKGTLANILRQAGIEPGRLRDLL